MVHGVGHVDGRRRRRRTAWRGGVAAEAEDGRVAGGAGVAVPGEAADAAVRQEDTLRGAEAERGEAAPDEGPLRQAHRRRVRRHLT